MPPPSKRTPIDFRRDIFAILFLALGVFTALCLASYSPTDPALNSASNVPYVKNLGGIVGAYIADVLYIVFGISAYFTSAVLLLLSVLQFLGRPLRLRVREAFYYVGMLAFAASLIHLKFETVSLGGHALAGGGIIGGLLGETLSQYFNRPGAYLISIAALLLFTTLATKLTLSEMLKIGRGFVMIGWRLLCKSGDLVGKGLATAFKGGIAGARAGVTRVKARREQAPETKEEKPEPAVIVRNEAPEPKFLRLKRTRDDEVVTLAPIRQPKGSLKLHVASPAEASPAAEETSAAAKSAGLAEATTSAAAGPKILKRADAKPRPSADQLKFQRISAEGYEPPPISLLDAGEGSKIEIDEETLKKNSMLLEKKLKDFDVDGRVVAIHPGPVITMYEYEPSAGTKVNKIVGLQDDLSLTLGGRSVRIVPHLPGKAALGIEIPNSDRETVWLRQTASSPQFAKAQSKLAIALGSSTAGHPVVTDLAKMPHLLVAGATGSGKSVAINSFIISILLKSSPADVRFILVDPKMLELSVYDGIPHLLLPVVTKPKKAVAAMRWAIREMERRYRTLADAGARHILGYNERVKSGEVKLTTPEEAQELSTTNPEAVIHTGPLPYIVIIIDELADLMMTASQDMEECITRLAQMARAAGIHLILATQRPSVDVITGLIKANFPARIAFKVTARHDSRTILDGNGAETLLGNGDMLFMTPQGGNIIRIHGCYVTDDDISRVVAHIKQQGEPVYDESIVADPAPGAAGAEFEEGDDELYDQAVKLVAETKQASISMVQRRLRIGYNRAARMIERMEAEGVIGPAEGSKPRQVLV
ncbi:MAG: DNA translocase FtsK 4TM domain-containing protein, partial [bacterium]